MTKIKIEGCGCRYRGIECEHLCDTHVKDYVLKLFNKDRNHLKSMREWLEIAKTMETKLTTKEEQEQE